MIKYHLWALTALTYSLVTAEPPVSSYLPPATGVPGPSSQYGPPGFGSDGNSPDSSRQGGFPNGGSNSLNKPGQFGSNRQKPQNNYGAPSDFGPSGSLSSEYGPPQDNQRKQNDFNNQQREQNGFPGQQRGKQTQNRPGTTYGPPNGSFGSRSDSQAPGREPDSNNSGGRLGSLGSQGFQQPENSYGPPNVNNQLSPDESGFRQSNQFSGSHNGRSGQLRNEGGLSQEYGSPNKDQNAGYDNQSPSSFGSPQRGSQGGLGQGGFGQGGLGQGGLGQGGLRQGGFGQEPSNRQPSTSYGVPRSSNQQTGSQGGRSGQLQNQRGLDQSYGPPNQNQAQNGGFGDQRGKPSFGSTGQGPQGRLAQGSSNRPPSSSYGVPDERSPLGDIGQGGRLSANSFGDQPENIPEKYQDGPSNFDGSEDSGEPAKYEFSYQVEDEESGANFGHSEQRDGDRTTGEYNVVLPDGRKQVVEYQADQRGYKPQIRYEGGAPGTGRGGVGGPAGSSGRGFGSESKGYPRGGPSQQVGEEQGSGYPSGGAGGVGNNQFSDNSPSSINPLSDTDNSGYSSGRPSLRGQGGLSGGQDSFSNQGRYQPDQSGNSGGYPRDRPQTPFGAESGSQNSQGGRPSFNQGIQRNVAGTSGYPRSETPGSNQERNRGDTTGYPRGGPSGFNQEQNLGGNAGLDQSKRGFGRNQSGNNENGYSRGGPGGFDQNTQGNSKGFGSSRQNGFGQNGSRDNSRGYPSGGPNNFGNTDRQTGNENQISEGYPSGGPSGRRGSGY